MAACTAPANNIVLGTNVGRVVVRVVSEGEMWAAPTASFEIVSGQTIDVRVPLTQR